MTDNLMNPLRIDLFPSPSISNYVSQVNSISSIELEDKWLALQGWLGRSTKYKDKSLALHPQRGTGFHLQIKQTNSILSSLPLTFGPVY